MRRFNPNYQGFQSSEEGKIIKSKRKFGFEAELVNEDEEEIENLAENTHSSFGFVSDSSIEGDSDDSAVEIVSPVLSGLAGESITKILFNSIKNKGFRVNKSCGLHIHLDGLGFKNDRRIFAGRISDLDCAITQKVKSSDTVFVINESLFIELRSRSMVKVDSMIRMLATAARTSLSTRVVCSNFLDDSTPDILVRRSTITQNGARIRVDYYDYYNKTELVREKHEYDPKEFEPTQDDILCTLKRDKGFYRVKTLLYFYSVYNDVFMALLPSSRRGNVFCLGLDVSFAPNQIENMTSYEDIENNWYRTTNIRDTNSNKDQHYNDSRYYNLNLHPLFSNGSTIEIRSHPATMSAAKVLYWVALHQTILDKIVSGDITIDKMRPATVLHQLDDKLGHFMAIVDPEPRIGAYINKRIGHFNNKNK